MSGIQEYSGAPFPCLGWLNPRGNSFRYLTTASMADSLVSEQSDCRASAQVPDFHVNLWWARCQSFQPSWLRFWPFLLVCQLALFLVFLLWSICIFGSNWLTRCQKLLPRMTHSSCFHISPSHDAAPSCTWILYNCTWVHIKTLNLNCQHLYYGWVLCPVPATLAKSFLTVNPSLQLVFLPWQINPC